ncbi:hypothetical protein P3686_24280, partial [Vibrio parahaemolyticus]|nr:hypothetical protein [Vibrio parahaemolyticus]
FWLDTELDTNPNVNFLFRFSVQFADGGGSRCIFPVVLTVATVMTAPTVLTAVTVPTVTS